MKILLLILIFILGLIGCSQHKGYTSLSKSVENFEKGQNEIIYNDTIDNIVVFSHKSTDHNKNNMVLCAHYEKKNGYFTLRTEGMGSKDFEKTKNDIDFFVEPGGFLNKDTDVKYIWGIVNKPSGITKVQVNYQNDKNQNSSVAKVHNGIFITKIPSQFNLTRAISIKVLLFKGEQLAATKNIISTFH